LRVGRRGAIAGRSQQAQVVRGWQLCRGLAAGGTRSVGVGGSRGTGLAVAGEGRAERGRRSRGQCQSSHRGWRSRGVVGRAEA